MTFSTVTYNITRDHANWEETKTKLQYYKYATYPEIDDANLKGTFVDI